MKYSKFTLKDYKAIAGELEIDIRKSLLPVIGINESGKTSILWGIFSFDSNNDTLNEGRHMKNVGNLYKTSNRGEASIIADIEATKEELVDIVDEIDGTATTTAEAKAEVKKFKRALSSWAGAIRIKRNLITNTYSIENSELKTFTHLAPLVIAECMNSTPYILYFDDFRDTIHEEIKIEGEPTAPKGWLAIIEQLFKKTNPSHSVFKLQATEELQRKSIMADVCKTLNNTLAKEWEKFTLEEGSRLDVDIQYDDKENKLNLFIKENIDGNDRFFGIQDRSKGFYWFFNFVMKLEFNPKVRSMDDKDTIYLLDEPGSYLHSSAQAKLCEKLASLSQNNVVIYCTHSHYLLDPDKIPLNYIKIAQKSGDGSVKLVSLPEYKDDQKDKRLAIQPIIDALKIKPFITDFNFEYLCIVEGIYDYYIFEMFQGENHNLKFLPAVNADSVKYFISIAIGWRVKYVAMWDNDVEGKKEFGKAQEFFGEHEAKKFLLLPSENPRKKSFILQDLFAGGDLKMIRQELGIPTNTAFEKTVLMLYFSDKRKEIVDKISDDTKKAAKYVYTKINELYLQSSHL
jgi:predicted ATP-binding protein involved in virulence